MIKGNELAIGIAAEHLVCADLLLQGYRAFLSDQNCPYDVAVEFNQRLIRIQVKATRNLRPVPQRKNHVPVYIWHVKRVGKSGKRIYSSIEFDIVALVALDIRCIAYLSIDTVVRQTVLLRQPNTIITHKNKRLLNVDRYPFIDALELLVK